MNTRKIENIFTFLNYHKIPLAYSIPFCLKVLGLQINEIAKQAGVTRGFFYQALTGKRKINEGIKRELAKLGIEL